ncbi:MULTISPECIES: YwdI family protein [Virgibacillus]|uniref:YwdI family protein n=1 Tax=Virgibacillus kapii TaxID=1638645 RepID=A0ABQ2DC81_9BACI|nr:MULTISPECIES: YwdI family protein [Virgibacillus]EQB38242.1 hypothetical protein M948_06600 [Virgibacillus sp. CM-4]GGJ53050.1 hypothetical protein GCM10007111_14070 [Virgibacillus kapii]
MAVANSTIIQKMINELQSAKQVEEHSKEMYKHISNVRLLCDLFLEEDIEENSKPTKTAINDISAAEMKAMLGEMKAKTHAESIYKSTADHDGANGESLFEF